MADRLAPAAQTPPERALEQWARLGHDEEAIWAGLVPGPTVAEVSGRLSAAPRELLDDGVDLRALAGDVLGAWPSGPVARGLDRVLDDAQGWTASRQGVAVGLWVYASEDLLGPFGTPLLRAAPDRLLAALGLRLAAVVEPYRWLVEADRREEAARAVLLWSGQHPDEDYPTARSRWSALDSLRRDHALRAALGDYLHRQEVARLLREQRAREAAARYAPE